jgi:protein-S-isoprenylcysteine O-methyltransferase Ste14
LLARPEPHAPGPIGPIGLSFGILIVGLVIQIAAKIVLGSRFGIVAANRGVSDLGPYRLVRHPMYAGYTVMHVAFLLAVPSIWNAAVYTLALIFQIIRIRREERILQDDPSYLAFARRVRYRLFPGLY